MLIYPYFDQLLTLPALLIIILVNFYYPCCNQQHIKIIMLKILSMLLTGLYQYHTHCLMKIASLFFFDVQSLFTNVPVKKTINIILDKVYNKKLIKTNLKKRTMKRLLLDSCTKTAFSFDNVLYEQCDGLSMWGHLWDQY